jgi:hypothetical protein
VHRGLTVAARAVTAIAAGSPGTGYAALSTFTGAYRVCAGWSCPPI